MKCPVCGAAELIPDVRDLPYTYKGETTLIPAVTGEFCPACGTHLFTRAPAFKAGLIIKVGSLDDQSQFDGPDTANFACDARPYHRLPTDIPVFQKWGR